MYRYSAAPSEATVMALSRVREVYGVRAVRVDEAARTVRLEYDATRLSEAIIHQLLRRTGLDVTERVALSAPPDPPPAPAPTPAS